MQQWHMSHGIVTTLVAHCYASVACGLLNNVRNVGWKQETKWPDGI
jgi:hypothetical protein